MKLRKLDQLPESPRPPDWCREVWVGSGFVAQVGAWCTGDQVFEFMGVRLKGSASAMSWARLQQVKNAVWGEAASACEWYPSTQDLVDVAPMRWLWRAEPPVGFHLGRSVRREEAAS